MADDDILSDGTKALEGPDSRSLPPDNSACFLISETPGVCLFASILLKKFIGIEYQKMKCRTG